MKNDKIAKLVRKIARTLEDEMNCGDCGGHVPVYVDAILAGEQEPAHWLLIRQHLEQCTACSQEFAMLVDAAKMDLEDGWPSYLILLEMTVRRQLEA